MLKRLGALFLLLTIAALPALATSHSHARSHRMMGAKTHHVHAYTRHLKSGKRVHVHAYNRK